MSEPTRLSNRFREQADWFVVGVALGLVTLGFSIGFIQSLLPWPWQLPSLIASALLVVLLAIRSNRRVRVTLDRVVDVVDQVASDTAMADHEPDGSAFDDVVLAVERLRRRISERTVEENSSELELTAVSSRPSPMSPALTRSGLYDPPLVSETSIDANASGDYSMLDMVSRLEPTSMRWLESSASEQEFLGWSLAELRQKSFLEIVHPDHRDLAREQLQASLIKGESHGLIYRITTARGVARAIEMSVSVRYSANGKVSYLRCHVSDVTDKLRASRELRRRTKELTQVNEQLRRINRELQELKDRYSDLYQNAPAMYFSLDQNGAFLECNNTLLRTLGYQRPDLIGRSYASILPEWRRATFAANFSEFLDSGSIAVESRWIKANGEEMDVWVAGTAIVGPDGAILRSRSVAQDVTARKALEAELKEKNLRLARANDELSRKNRELDEFTYVVSHDLQEPIRTLNAFSDFLMRDYGNQLDAEGREFVTHLVAASRRMRTMIDDLLTLSRTGRVAGDFGAVQLDSIIDVIRADFAELIRSREAVVSVHGPLPTVWGDRERLVQLFGNLISNGLKYNQAEHPKVEIGSLSRDADAKGSATVYVRDNGIGIDPRFHTKIFQIFRRLHARDEYEGTGAGLAICQKIVQAHGGRIWVESEVGQGATFHLSLPTPPVPDVTSRSETLHVP